jgi:CYTH domain-containing protein/thymidylate kinase
MIAITGGPCGGKSTFLARVAKRLKKYDIHPIIITEAATELIKAGVLPTMIGWDVFQEELLQYALAREDHYIEMARQMPDQKIVILCDRGLLDSKAYMGEENFRNMAAEFGYNETELRNRYAMVIHLVTAAKGAPSFYTLKNNRARTESPELAIERDEKIEHAWHDHPHHVMIDNSTDFAEKMKRALRALARRLDMPEPYEIERKWKIRNFRQEFIPENASVSHITQDYLLHEGKGEHRVRKSVCNDEVTFYFTEKFPTGKSGQRIEREKLVTEAEYSALLATRDNGFYTIHKTRYKFPFASRIFEVDIFEAELLGRLTLEVEVGDIKEVVLLPPTWDLLEVTDDPNEKNYAQAKKKA